MTLERFGWAEGDFTVTPPRRPADDDDSDKREQTVRTPPTRTSK